MLQVPNGYSSQWKQLLHTLSHAARYHGGRWPYSVEQEPAARDRNDIVVADWSVFNTGALQQRIARK